MKAYSGVAQCRKVGNDEADDRKFNSTIGPAVLYIDLIIGDQSSGDDRLQALMEFALRKCPAKSNGSS